MRNTASSRSMGNRAFINTRLDFPSPCFSCLAKARSNLPRLNPKLPEQHVHHRELIIRSQYDAAKLSYQKWKDSWEYYQTEALPLAKKEKEAALLAYREGEIPYMELIQHLQAILETRMDANDALSHYIQSQFELEYFTTPNQ